MLYYAGDAEMDWDDDESPDYLDDDWRPEDDEDHYLWTGDPLWHGWTPCE